MRVPTWLRPLAACPTRVARRSRPGRDPSLAARRPSVEYLEDRITPSGPPQFGPASQFGPATLAAAAVRDFDGDGRLDLVALGQDGQSILFFQGRGDGTFVAPQTQTFTTTLAHTGPGITYSLLGADFNRDGKPDLATGSGFDDTMNVLLGNGDGSFQAPVAVSGFLATGVPGTVSPGQQLIHLAQDANGDGNPDLLAYFDGGLLSIALGNGDGTFQPPTHLGVGDFRNDIQLADVNQDGKPDLLTDDPFAVDVRLGNGDGTFQSPTLVGFIGTGLTIGDFNGDGNPDILCDLGVSLGNGDGTFRTSFSLLGLVVGTAADLNGDGKLDVAGTNGSDFVVAMGAGGDGLFGSPVHVGSGAASVRLLAVADLNNDGKPDLVGFARDSHFATVGFVVALNSTSAAGSPTVTVTGGSFTYDGQPHPATGSVTGAHGEDLGPPTLEYSSIDIAGNVVIQFDAPILPGTYSVVAFFAGNGTYQSASATASLTIAFAAESLTGLLPAVVPADRFGPRPNASPDEAFIRGLYRLILGRDAASSEVAAYVQALGANLVTRPRMIDNFWNSPEHRTREVVGYYQSFLGRDASAFEINFYVNALQSGVSEEQIASDFLHSPEANTSPDAVYVQRLYQGVIGRAPSDSEVQFYVNVLQTGQATRDDLVRNFLHAPESVGAAVDNFYLAYLQRTASQVEHDFYVNPIEAGQMSYAAVAKTILGSPEFVADAAAAVS